MDKFFKDKVVLVTGVCGTVGAELARQLLVVRNSGIRELIGIDNDEGALFLLDQEYIDDDRANLFVTDIRDRDELVNKFQGVDIVFHCAALKHVVLCERSPEQAVLSNVLGIQNVIHAALHNKVEKVIFTSSDKAVNPTNVMGTSKLMGERLMTAANSSLKGEGPIFTSTRFGNVLGSSGSVVPVFHNQIAKGGPITLTDNDMTRFIMSIEDAVQLVIDSAVVAKGGEVLITKMPVVYIRDLAIAMIRELAPMYGHDEASIEIKITGTKPGEKLYEELMSQEETRRALELENYYAILPAFRGLYRNISYEYSGILQDQIQTPYNSSEVGSLAVDQIRTFLTTHKLLGKPRESISNRYWPGDKEEREN